MVTVVVFFGRPRALFGGGVEHGEEREQGRLGEDFFSSQSLFSFSLRRKGTFVRVDHYQGKVLQFLS